jgi:glycosyltransferase involved in cell wall biosynthesis
MAIVASAAGAERLRGAGITVPLILWTMHLPDFGPMRELHKRTERSAWLGYVFVSQWQREQFIHYYGIEPNKTHVLLNAIAPSFEELPIRRPWFEVGSPPILVYTSTPFRGLAILLDAFVAIRNAIPEAKLRIFSGMTTYQAPEQDQVFMALYDKARNIEQVDLIGPISQPTLANEIIMAAALAYPSIYPETSCIAAMEAMSCGASIFTTRLGALPETVGSYGQYVDYSDDHQFLTKSYADLMITSLRYMMDNQDICARLRAEQASFVRKNLTWANRALEWDRLLTSMTQETK